MPPPIDTRLQYPSPYVLAVMQPNFYPPRNITGNFYRPESQQNFYLNGPPPPNFFPQNPSVPENLVPSSNRSNLIVVPMEPTEGPPVNQTASFNVSRFPGPPSWFNQHGFVRPPSTFGLSARGRGYPVPGRPLRIMGYQARCTQQGRERQNGQRPRMHTAVEGLKGLLPQDKWASPDNGIPNTLPASKKKSIYCFIYIIILLI